VRLWMCRRDGAHWRDLLQEAIARTLLEKRRSPEEALEALFAAQALEPLLEASTYVGFEAPEAQAIAARAKKLVARRDMSRRRIDALAARLDNLPRGPVTNLCELAIRNLDVPLLEALEALDRWDVDLAEQKATSVLWVMAGGNLKTVCEVTMWDLYGTEVDATLRKPETGRRTG